MAEKLRYLKHHVDRVKYWDTEGVTPEDAAKRFIHSMNNPIYVEPKVVYPETPEFIKAMARLIEAHRNGEEIEILDDWKGNIYFDPMCNACRYCGNSVQDLQLCLPGFGDI